VVTLMHNRGATVSKPSVREAREVFAARRVIEAHIVEAFIKTAARKDVKRLQDHLAREEEAWRNGRRRAMLKLSGEFHLLLAEAADNRIMLELLRDLVSRSSLIIAVYQAPGASPCPPDAHRELTASLERRERSAIKLMTQHLDHLCEDLMLEERSEAGVDLRSVFGVHQ
jgi:DNA-binding GntR family transcriptional regulator